MSKKTLTIVVTVFIFLLFAIQFIPVIPANPPEKAPFPGDLAVSPIFEKACYDCHSNQTKWIWYTHIAPLSWMIAHHVKEGREHLNFSNWGLLDPKVAAHAADEIWEHVEEGEMPLLSYRLGHPEARLTEQEKMTIKEWSTAFEKKVDQKQDKSMLEATDEREDTVKEKDDDSHDEYENEHEEHEHD